MTLGFDIIDAADAWAAFDEQGRQQTGLWPSQETAAIDAAERLAGPERNPNLHPNDFRVLTVAPVRIVRLDLDVREFDGWPLDSDLSPGDLVIVVKVGRRASS